MSKLQLSRKFVQEAYDVANSNWKDKIIKEFPKLLQSSTLAKLKEMTLECYKVNSLFYKSFSFYEDIKIVPADAYDFYVAVKLPGANIDWTLSAFAFIRHFVEYMKTKGIYTYPVHYNEAVKAMSEKLSWPLSEFLLIYVKSPSSGLDVDDKELFETSEEFVKEAHKAACKDWKKKIEEQFPELFKTEKTYPIGTRLIINLTNSNEEFMIVGIDGKAYAVSVNDGMLWSNLSMDVVNLRVSLSELQKHIKPISFQIL
jgi:hypothetical protein